MQRKKLLSTPQSLRFIKYSTLALTAMLFAAPVLASADEEKWKGELGLGGIRTGGNTQVQSINTRAKAGKSWGAFHLDLAGTTLGSSFANTVTAEKYTADLGMKYDMTDRAYLLSGFNFTKERFSGYRHRVTETIGGGYTLIKTDAHTLDLATGWGLRQSKKEVSGISINEGIGGVAISYGWKISPTASFSQLAYNEIGKENTVTRFRTDLTLKILGNLSAQLGFYVTHTSKVPAPTIKKTDTESVVNMVYSF